MAFIFFRVIVLIKPIDLMNPRFSFPIIDHDTSSKKVQQFFVAMETVL